MWYFEYCRRRSATVQATRPAAMWRRTSLSTVRFSTAVSTCGMSNSAIRYRWGEAYQEEKLPRIPRKNVKR